MSFQPCYAITHRLLANVKRIGEIVTELNSRSFPQTVLVEFEKDARAVSTYASTSIEGNPLPFTEVPAPMPGRWPTGIIKEAH